MKILSVGEHFGTSDHQIIRWNILAYKVIQKQIKSYNDNKGDHDKIKDEAGSINYNEIVTVSNLIESDWSRLKLFFEKMRPHVYSTKKLQDQTKQVDHKSNHKM